MTVGPKGRRGDALTMPVMPSSHPCPIPDTPAKDPPAKSNSLDRPSDSPPPRHPALSRQTYIYCTDILQPTKVQLAATSTLFSNTASDRKLGREG
jgi:hypothetical protein